MSDADQKYPGRMNVAQFLAWSDEQEDGARFELHYGQVHKAQSERLDHAVVKSRVFMALRQAIVSAKLHCHALPDGMAVPIDEDMVFEPDAQVYCGVELSPETVLVRHPIIVIEVLSPATRRYDLTVKLINYFRNPSIEHYLVVAIGERKIIHYRRPREGEIDTRIIAQGALALDPPGLSLQIADIFPDGVF